MELVEFVNKKVGIRIKETLSPGQVMKAMILNGLGFLSAPIYLFDTFFVGKALLTPNRKKSNTRTIK